MKRRQLFEFEDCPWFPKLFRNFMTDYLQFVSSQFNLFGGAVPILTDLLQRTSRSEIVDIASGGGGPWLSLIPKLQEDFPNLRIRLTDYFPNQTGLRNVESAFPETVEIESRRVDAKAVPSDLSGLRTQFLSLHHFNPDEVKDILRNAIAAKEPIAIFEAQQRDVEHCIRFALSPIFVLLLTPFVRPFRILRLVFTYLIPLIPLFVFWDGIVSVLRTYTVDEMLEMASEADEQQSFEWKAEVINGGQIKLPYLIGWPIE
ncbi:hypothetical protein [uncultured Gimesia sp.]|uniref:hypothetical protein n=1 Tax=uncultured Gimesia sp. TaxID=1678688 RepID=UPI00260769C8|nr:hypothetical protein [uncultured Gimesia sp.]